VPRSAELLDDGAVQVLIATSATLAIAALWLAVPLPVLPLAVMIGIIAVAIALARPFLMCLAFFVFSFFRIHEAYPVLNPLHLPLAFAALTALSLGWHMVVARTIQPYWSRELTVFAVFFVMATLGIAYAFNRPVALDLWIGVFSKIGLMTIAIAWLARRETDFMTAARVFVLAGLLVCLVAIYNKHMGIDLVEMTRVTIGQDLGSLLGDPNDLALVLLFPLGFSVALALHRTGRLTRILGMIAIPFTLYAIVATQSRGGLLGVLAVFLVFGLRFVRSRALLVAMLPVAGAIGYSVMGIADRVSGGAAEPGIDASAAGRLEAWVAAVNMALARPLSGVGIGNFSESLYVYANNFPGRDMTAHSTWFGVLGETGLAGFLVFATLVVMTVRSSLRSMVRLDAAGASPPMRAVALGLLAALAGFCVAGSFLSQGFTWPFYTLLGLTVAVARYTASLTAVDQGRVSPEEHSPAPT
jgi:putative inorganic carbon (hco3(-)) transporter